MSALIDLSAFPETACAERRAAERCCHWLYLVSRCDTMPRLQEPLETVPFPWHDVSKVVHYWLEVNAVTKPTQVWEESPHGSSSGEAQ